ncbi:hypothetical protein BGW37DRAFT_540240 [Umbelopsis sp. PMI_123]|nr:hypothetical protein BGW37DRAFT_540240 [Umbelopsis sp. PMI_123]
MADGLITQVSYPQDISDIDTSVSNEDPLPSTLKFELRGKQFVIARETLISLPESLLISMFPHGLAVNLGDESSFASLEDPAYAVDYNPDCLDFVLRFLEHCNRTFAEERSMREDILLASAALGDISTLHSIQYQLLTKQAIIVLREELEYYTLPPRSTPGMNIVRMNDIKRNCGRKLEEQNHIFAPLERNIKKEDNTAEQHLIDMLCQSGYSRSDIWNHRALEPKQTCIMSIALTKLQTQSEEAYLPTAQKMLLFWKKPARKCWWEVTAVEVYDDIAIRVWCRRTWTLELCLF